MTEAYDPLTMSATSGGMTRFEPAPAVSRMDLALAALTEAVTEIGKAVETAETRLTPVMREASAPAPSATLTAARESGGQATEAVHEQADRVQLFAARLSDVLSRLDV